MTSYCFTLIIINCFREWCRLLQMQLFDPNYGHVYCTTYDIRLLCDMHTTWYDNHVVFFLHKIVLLTFLVRETHRSIVKSETCYRQQSHLEESFPRMAYKMPF